MDAQLKDRISQMVAGSPVFLFMKGNPTFPSCGFSNQVVQILKSFEIEFGHFDVLSDMDVRQGIKEFSDWPTIPQLYIQGEFIGGCDIVRDAWENGELRDQLQTAFPDKEVKQPKPPAKPVNISPAEAKVMMEKEGVKGYDVRTLEEREIASLDGFPMLDQEAAEHIRDKEDKETPLIFICHYGGRSAQACEYFSNLGFQKVYNVVGGIDNWSQTVDPTVPRY